MLQTLYGLLLFFTVHPFRAYMTFMLYTTLGGKGPHGLDLKSRVVAWKRIEEFEPGVTDDKKAVILTTFIPPNCGDKFLRQELWTRWIVFACTEPIVLTMTHGTKQPLHAFIVTVLCLIGSSAVALIVAYLAAMNDYSTRMQTLETWLSTREAI